MDAIEVFGAYAMAFEEFVRLEDRFSNEMVATLDAWMQQHGDELAPL